MKTLTDKCSTCKMWTETGCADDVEKSELVNGVCEEYFEQMKVVDSVSHKESLAEQDLYM